jgi:hypothetical protein
MRAPGGGIFINLVVGELVASGDVLLADRMVHVGFNAARSDGIHAYFLVSAVWLIFVSFKVSKRGIGQRGVGRKGMGSYEPMAMQRVNVSMAPLEPE